MSIGEVVLNGVRGDICQLNMLSSVVREFDAVS